MEAATWYLVQCKAREGFKAEQHLTIQGFTCFHPVQWQRSSQLGKGCIAKLESLFPYYVFLRVNAEQSLATVSSTRGVLKLVSFGVQPLQVPETLVESLQYYCRQHAQPPAEHKLAAGDRVKIIEGPFSELEATVHRANAKDRVVLLLNLLGRETQVEVTQAQIKMR